MNRVRPIALVVALIGGFAAAGSSQAPADRAALVAFRDSLARVTDTLALRRLEGAMIEVARGDRDNALLHLRLGLLAHRLGEAGGGKSHYEDAAGEFEWATELKSDWPWGWYGLGLAELALGEHDVIAIENVRQILGKDYLTKAASAFARAAEADPTFAAAVTAWRFRAMRGASIRNCFTSGARKRASRMRNIAGARQARSAPSTSGCFAREGCGRGAFPAG